MAPRFDSGNYASRKLQARICGLFLFQKEPDHCAELFVSATCISPSIHRIERRLLILLYRIPFRPARMRAIFFARCSARLEAKLFPPVAGAIVLYFRELRLLCVFCHTAPLMLMSNIWGSDHLKWVPALAFKTGITCSHKVVPTPNPLTLGDSKVPAARRVSSQPRTEP